MVTIRPVRRGRRSSWALSSPSGLTWANWATAAVFRRNSLTYILYFFLIFAYDCVQCFYFSVHSVNHIFLPYLSINAAKFLFDISPYRNWKILSLTSFLNKILRTGLGSLKFCHKSCRNESFPFIFKFTCTSSVKSFKIQYLDSVFYKFKKRRNSHLTVI